MSSNLLKQQKALAAALMKKKEPPDPAKQKKRKRPPPSTGSAKDPIAIDQQPNPAASTTSTTTTSSSGATKKPSVIARFALQAATVAASAPSGSCYQKRPMMIKRPSTLRPATNSLVYPPFSTIFNTPPHSTNAQIPADYVYLTLLSGSLTEPPPLPSSLPRTLPLHYSNIQEYQAHNIPLLLDEMHSELTANLTESLNKLNFKYLEQRVQHIKLSDFVGNTTIIEGQTMKVQSPVIPSTITELSYDDKKKYEVHYKNFRPNDVLLVMRSSLPISTLSTLETKTPDPRLGTDTMLIQVKGSRNSLDGLFVRAHSRALQRLLAADPPLPNQDHLPLAKRRFHSYKVLKIGSLVTSLREYHALCQLASLPILATFLKTEPAGGSTPIATTPVQIQNNLRLNQSQDEVREIDREEKERALHILNKNRTLGRGFIEYLGKRFNPSQLTAVAASAEKYGMAGDVTLIKGPPGTGKTTTLVGVLNALHLAQTHRYQDGVADMGKQMAAGNLGNVAIQQMWKAAVSKKPRILVAAPSNGAVDNIIMKIMETGFIDGSGRKYNPSICRFGRGQTKQVADVSLDKLVDDIYEGAADESVMAPRIAHLNKTLRELKDLIHMLVLTLRYFKACSPAELPLNWDVKVMENFAVQGHPNFGRIYFVDHNTKKTSFVAPTIMAPGCGVVLEKTPGYRTALTALIKNAERHAVREKELANCELAKGRDDHSGRMEIETNLLEHMQIVFVTLGGAGSASIQSTRQFETVVVDEAAQSTEASTLSALMLGSAHVVLCGDPHQLPATVTSNRAKSHGYDRSLFERLEVRKEGDVCSRMCNTCVWPFVHNVCGPLFFNTRALAQGCGHRVTMLATQYRMRSEISKFPRAVFYDNKLRDGSKVDARPLGESLMRCMKDRIPMLAGAMTFLDLESQEEKIGTGLVNYAEARLCVQLVEQLQRAYGADNLKGKIGVITPYAKQVGVVKRAFTSNHSNHSNLVDVEVNTVDGYQGREKDIIILSAVRAGPGKGVGFLSQHRRVNVALTRPREMLIVVAHAKRVANDKIWKELRDDCRRRGNLVSLRGNDTNDLTRVERPGPEWDMDDDDEDLGGSRVVGRFSDCFETPGKRSDDVDDGDFEWSQPKIPSLNTSESQGDSQTTNGSGDVLPFVVDAQVTSGARGSQESERSAVLPFALDRN